MTTGLWTAFWGILVIVGIVTLAVTVALIALARIEKREIASRKSALIESMGEQYEMLDYVTFQVVGLSQTLQILSGSRSAPSAKEAYPDVSVQYPKTKLAR